MLKVFPKDLNFENISKKCIRVPRPLKMVSNTFTGYNANWSNFARGVII